MNSASVVIIGVKENKALKDSSLTPPPKAPPLRFFLEKKALQRVVSTCM